MRKMSLAQAIVYATQLGATLAISVLIGLFVGIQVDNRMGIGVPVFTAVGSMVGFAAGIYGMLRLVQTINARVGE